MNNIINPLIAQELDNEDLNLLRDHIVNNRLNGARLLIERNMIGLEKDDPKHIILNEAYDQIINEIEMAYQP